MNEYIQNIIERVTGMTRGETTGELLFEWAVIFLAIFLIIHALRGTRGARALQGVILILLIPVLLLLVTGNQFERLDFLLEKSLTLGAIAVLIIFQTELRRAVVWLGEIRFFSTARLPGGKAVGNITEAMSYLSRNRIGALIAIERQITLSGLVSSGVPLNADISASLLESIFYPGSALHDLGVVIRGDKILAAGAQFPLSESGVLPKEMGSRHRAAFGLCEEVDALVIVVSEESGIISICERSNIYRFETVEEFTKHLIQSLGTTPEKISTAKEEDNA